MASETKAPLTWQTNIKDGEYKRKDAVFRNWITADGSSEFPAEADRYHLYVSLACPWAHRTLIVRELKGLQKVIGVTVVDWLLGEGGWNFTKERPKCSAEPFYGARFLREIYAKADPDYRGSITVPVLWDKKRHTIVNNESSEIIQMFNSQFNQLCATPDQARLDLAPSELKADMDAINDKVYASFNNGVYRCGFATTQEAYDDAVVKLFAVMDELEQHLAKQRYLVGSSPTSSQLTLSDVRLFTTMVRFDWVYHGHFKCNKKRMVDYPNLWAYCRDLYTTGGIAATVDREHITKHYYQSHRSVNPHGIVAIGPDLDFKQPHHREKLQ